MWPRLKRSQFLKQRGLKNKNNFKKIVHSGIVPGIIAYANNLPVAWCSGLSRKNGKYPDTFAFTGLASAYKKAGFKEVIRRSSTRPIMRYLI